VGRLFLKLLVGCLLWFTMGCGGGNFARMTEMASPRRKRAAKAKYLESESFHGAARASKGDYLLAQNGPGGTVAPGLAPPPGTPSDLSRSPKVVTPPGPAKQPLTKARALLIYTATLHMAVFEAKSALRETQKLAEKLGGYLVKRSDNSIVIRVPSGRFKGALEAITEKGDVLHRKENVEDVTERFYDLRTRLNNARTMRARFVKLLEKADSVKDALAVEKELARVTTVIEGLEGKLKRMSELISFSTITVLFKPAPVQRIKSKVKLPFRWLNRLGLPHLLRL
jgi:hypothetical protein